MALKTDEKLQQVQERLISVTTLLHETYNENLKLKKMVNEKSKYIIEDKKFNKELSKQVMAIFLKEEENLKIALSKIYEIKEICNQRNSQTGHFPEMFHRRALMKELDDVAKFLPLYISSDGNKNIPPLVGAVPPESNYVAKKGDMVAALVKTDDPEADSEDNWILSTVVSYDAFSKRYEVEDIDEIDQKSRYVLSRKFIKALPLMRANPQTEPAALYKKGVTVLAVYPQTTCFYCGIIDSPPETSSDDYKIIFEDNTFPSGYAPPVGVHQRYVLPLKVSKRQQKAHQNNH